MKTKHPLIHPTVLLKDITRFCPVWILYTLLLFMSGMSMLTVGLFIPGQFPSAVGNSLNLYPFVSMIYSIICAMCLFGDQFKSRLCNGLHAMPIRRESWFATHTLSAILFFLIPNSLVSLFFLPLLGKCWFIAPLWLLNTTVQSLFFLSLAVFSVQLAGNRIAAVAVYLLINFLTPLCYWFLNAYYAPLLPGLHIQSTVFDYFCPSISLCSREFFLFEEYYISTGDFLDTYGYRYQGMTSQWWYLTALVPIALALFGLGLLLQRRRKLEAAGDFLAFPKVSPVFHVFFTLAIGAVFQAIFSLFSANLLTMVIGMAVGCLAGLMLLQRTVKIFTGKNMLRCGILVATLVLTLVATILDPLGLTRWTPKADRVEAVVVSDAYEYTEEEEFYGFSSATVTDPEQIRSIIETHRALVKRRFLLQPALLSLFSEEVRSVHLTYRLESGIEVSRRYYYVDPEIDKQLFPLYCTPEFQFGYPDWDSFAAGITEISINDEAISKADYAGFLKAMKADCETGALYTDDYTDPDTKTICIITGEIYHYLDADSDCVHIKAWIEKHR